MRIAERQQTIRIDCFSRVGKVRSSSNAQGRQPRHRITTASRSDHESLCQLWQHIRRSSHRAEPVVSSWSRGTCRTDRSHMTWSLEEVTQQISCNLCAQEFDDLQTCFAHARMTHLPFPAPTTRVSRHAQPIRPPRRNRQHVRNGHQREPRVHQERRSGRRGATTPKAAPTNLKQNQARRGNQRIDDSGGQAQSRRQVRAEEPQQNHAQGRPQDASDDARLVVDGMGHSPDQGIEPRSGQHAKTDADLRG